MPNYNNPWGSGMPTVGAGQPNLPNAPAIPKPIKYPEMDIGGLQDWLSSMMARQLMPGRLTPERVGGIANQMLGPLMQTKAQYPFQKYGAETQAQQWGAGMETGMWGTRYGGALEQWAKQLMAMLQMREMQQRERFAGRESMSPMERAGGYMNLRP